MGWRDWGLLDKDEKMHGNEILYKNGNEEQSGNSWQIWKKKIVDDEIGKS